MYRIIFNPKLGAWQIQLKNGIFFWQTIKNRQQDEPTLEDAKFFSYDAAVEFVGRTGLNKVYRNWHDRPATQLLNSNVQQVQPTVNGYAVVRA